MSLSLEDQLLAYLRSKSYEPQDASAIARGMGISSQERPALRAILKEWQDNGTLQRLKGARLILRQVVDSALEGRIHKAARGKLFFIPNEAALKQLRNLTGFEDAGHIELPIREHRDGGAMHGDIVRVTVKLNTSAQFTRSKKRRHTYPDDSQLRPEARVEEILERRAKTWIGTYQPGGRYGYMQGDGRSAPERVRLTAPAPQDVQPGMVITVSIGSYARERMEPTGTVETVLGYPDEAGVDLATVIQRHALKSDFPASVLAEADALPGTIPAQEYENRDDWRDRLVFTIDPDTAKDYDDAISIRPLDNDCWELAVHIADVSYYVAPNSELDREAYLRGNSTYLPDYVIPMLPPRLCDDLCSLKQGVDRLTRLCLMRINRKGEVFRAEFRNAVICSRRRLDYATALAVIENRASTGDDELDEALQQAHHLANKLRQRRMKAGALNLEVPELKLKMDDNGKVIAVEEERSDAAHQMIEEFMLAANEAVAKALSQQLTPTIYRIHEEPDPAKLFSFANLARSYGIDAGALTSREELSRVAEAIHGHVDENILTTALLRAMMRARYSTEALGHFGLAKGDYCHFTSPIRRYADLLVHRGFERLVRGKQATIKLPDIGQLSSIAEHISETERISAIAEKEAVQMKLATFLEDECQSDTPRSWEAVITDSYPQGMAVEVPMLRLKGFISGDELGSRWYFERHTRRWSSFDGQFLLPGATITVVPIYIDRSSYFADFRPILEK